MTHFVLIIPFATPDFHSFITKRLSENFSYWHWAPECWLLASDDLTLDAASVRDTIRGFLNTGVDVSFMVLRIDLPKSGTNWALNGSVAIKQEWAQWLRQFWEYKPPNK